MESKEQEINSKLLRVGLLVGAATAGFHGYTEAFTENGHGIRMPAWETERKTGTQVITERIGEGEPRLITSSAIQDTPGKQEPITAYKLASAPYARQFDQDSAASETDTEAIQSLHQIISDAQSLGWQNLELRIHGIASAEDDADTDDAGLMTPSDKNIRLANARREAFINDFTQVTPTDLHDSLTITKVDGVENDLSNTDYEGLQHQAEHFGYQSVRDMVQAWQNNPEAVPPTVVSNLDILLGNERGVYVEIFGQSTDTSQQIMQTKKELVCAIPVRETTVTEHTTEPWLITLPYAIPIAVFGTPLGLALASAAGAAQRRRRTTDDRATANSGPYVPMPIANVLTTESKKRTLRFPGTGLGDITASKPPIQGKYRPEPPRPPMPPRPPKQPQSPSKIGQSSTAETIVYPPYKPEKSLRGCAGVALKGAGIGLLIASVSFGVLKACEDNSQRASEPQKTAPIDPCEGLPERQIITERAELRSVDGVIRHR